MGRSEDCVGVVVCTGASALGASEFGISPAHHHLSRFRLVVHLASAQCSVLYLYLIEFWAELGLRSRCSTCSHV